MSEKRFYLGNNDTTICDRSQGGSDGFNMLTIFKVVDLLNEQQATISVLKDIFKDIITYSEWDSKKPYCSLGIAVDRKTYYKIREILNE